MIMNKSIDAFNNIQIMEFIYKSVEISNNYDITLRK